MAVTLVSTGIQFPDASILTTASNMAGCNKIINGAMVIDQRNAGASVLVNSAAAPYTVDRWLARAPNGAGAFTVQRSTTAPAGFKNSLLCTVTSSASVGAEDIYFLQQRIEGFNIADFGFGAAGAATVTVSFWVRSSLTGNFGASIGNNIDYSYPFSFTINAANTFEQKTVTIPGPTSGTWSTDSSTGLLFNLSLGTGSNYLGTANTWGNYWYAPTGSVNPITTNGATFYITGVQLEKGSVATPFEYRPYGTELQLCQRYFQSVGGTTSVPWASSQISGSNGHTAAIFFPVTMRSAPSLEIIGTGFTAQDNNAGPETATISLTAASAPAVYLTYTTTGALTSNAARHLNTTNSTSFLRFNAEL